jgi:hypothetical protein
VGNRHRLQRRLLGRVANLHFACVELSRFFLIALSRSTTISSIRNFVLTLPSVAIKARVRSRASSLTGRRLRSASVHSIAAPSTRLYSSSENQQARLRRRGKNRDGLAWSSRYSEPTSSSVSVFNTFELDLSGAHAWPPLPGPSSAVGREPLGTAGKCFQFGVTRLINNVSPDNIAPYSRSFHPKYLSKDAVCIPLQEEGISLRLPAFQISISCHVVWSPRPADPVRAVLLNSVLFLLPIRDLYYR